MMRNDYDVRAVYDDRGMVAGYVWQKHGRTAWGAMLVGFCECCAPEKRLGSFPELAAAAAAVVADLKARARQ
jgi:hypothetical protein